MAQMALRMKLERARDYWRALLAAEGGLWTFAALILALVACFHIDLRLVLSVEARVAAWAVLGVLFSVGGILLVVRPLLAPRPPEAVAVLVERHYPQLRERLLSAVEFDGLSEERVRGVSAALIDDIRADAASAAEDLDFQPALRPAGLRRAGAVAGGAIAVLALHMLLAGPAFGAFLSRMTLANTPVWRDTRVRLDPLRGKVLRGSPLRILVTQEGKHVEQARFRYRLGEGRWQSVVLRSAGDTFTQRFESVTEPLSFEATAGDGISDRGLVEVVEPAAIVGATLRLVYPAYLERPAATVTSQSGGIAAPLGTRASVVLQANKPLAEAEVTLGGSRPTAWPVSGSEVRGTVDVRANGQYTLRLRDTDGFYAPEPQSFPIKAIPDQAPEVQLLDPTGDLEVVPGARVRLSITARDDYGVHQVRVPYEVEGRKPGVSPAGAGGRRERTVELDNLWELAPLRLKPGDTLRYRVEATDFDTLTGPHVGRTGDFQIRIIDRGEAERRYEEERSEILRQLEELTREQRAARSQVDVQRAAPRLNADALAGTEERQRAAATTADDLARRIGDLRRAAEMNDLARRPELESQAQAQASLDRLAREAMPQAANRIGGAQAQAASSPQQSRSELGQASQQQQQIIEELARIAQQMRPGSELQRMAERFERLAAEQRSLQSQTEQMLPQTLGKNMDELTPPQRAALQQQSQQQQSLQRATTQALENLERTARGMQAARPEQAQAAQQAAGGLRQAQVPEQQSQAAQNTQQNALGQARSQQENAAQELENAARELRSAENSNDPQALQRQLQQAVNQLQRMLRKQEEAMQQTRAAMTPEQRQQLAQAQREMQRQAQEMARQLQRLQRRAPSAGRASRSLQQAQSSLGQSGQSLQQGSQQEALNQQEQARQAMQRAMASLQQAQAEAGQQDDPFAALRKELRKLAGQQKEVLQATRRLDQEQQQRGARTEDGDALRKLSTQQAEVESEAGRLEKDLPGEVFRAFSEDARRSMTRAKQGLDAGSPKTDPTQQSQQRALTLVEQLARALDADPKDNSEAESGGGGGGEGQSGKPDPELPKRIAEIRLLRFMEQAIRGETQELDDARKPLEPLSDAQKARLQGTAQQQTAARALAGKVTQGLARYRSLAGKVDQAGKHMSEAQRGLDRGDSGDPVQEEEQQAIIRLTDALRQAQQQQRQQQQQASRQRRQGQQQGQQQGPPMGGTPQEGQGAQPAMRSVRRSSNGQGGPLGSFGDDARGFGGLDPRTQDALRQGFKEKSPAEYQELINRYYRALSNVRR